MAENTTRQWMRLALDCAKRAWGETHPNPMVGAVVVEHGTVAAQGWHRRSGGPHAEIEALKQLGRAPQPGATLYVTLEPCSTKGRTGACTDAIIESRIQHVVIGCRDPNPAHNGRGIEALEEAGLQVVVGVLEEECRDLNMIFNHWITQKRPLLAAKIATTLDGAVATRSGESQWITGDSARGDVHRWRRLFPAIAVGSGTISTDNPALTARLPGQDPWAPWRFIFDRRGETIRKPLPKVYQDEHAHRSILVTRVEPASEAWLAAKQNGAQAWCLEGDDEQFWDEFSRRCFEHDISGVFFEGGSRLLSKLLCCRALDYLFHYRAPMLLADHEAPPAFDGRLTNHLAHALRLRDVRHQIYADDQLIRGFLVYP